MTNGDFAHARGLMDALEQLENELILHYRDSPHLFCIVSRWGLFHHVNTAWEYHLGWTHTELMVRSWMSLIHPDDLDALARHLRVMESGELVGAPVRLRHKEGRYVHFHLNASRWSGRGITYAQGERIDFDSTAAFPRK